MLLEHLRLTVFPGLLRSCHEASFDNPAARNAVCGKRPFSPSPTVGASCRHRTVVHRQAERTVLHHTTKRPLFARRISHPENHMLLIQSTCNLRVVVAKYFDDVIFKRNIDK